MTDLIFLIVIVVLALVVVAWGKLVVETGWTWRCRHGHDWQKHSDEQTFPGRRFEWRTCNRCPMTDGPPRMVQP